MEMNRREFVILAATAAAGCAAEGGGNGSGAGAGSPAALTAAVVDAGPAADYAADGVYDRFRDGGFFVIRESGRLFALSAVCTHRRCKLNARPDHSFACKCHGSAFNPQGKVIKGPATRDLPELPTTIDAAGHLLVQVPGTHFRAG